MMLNPVAFVAAAPAATHNWQSHRDERRAADPHRALQRALLGWFADQPCRITVAMTLARPWASATFTGIRHAFDLTLSGDRHRATATAFEAALDAIDWTIAGHFVADIAIVRTQSDATETVLTVEALSVAGD